MKNPKTSPEDFRKLIKRKKQIIIDSADLLIILDTLKECYELIELNTKGLVFDEKDSARIILHKYGYLKHPKLKKVKNGDKKSKNKKTR